MQIARPILLVTTPLGVVGGLHAAYKISAGLAFLMAVMVSVMACAIASVVLAIRREQAAETLRAAAASGGGDI